MLKKSNLEEHMQIERMFKIAMPSAKKLASSVITAHVIVEAIHYFNMNSVDDQPAVLIDMENDELGDEEKQQLLFDPLLTFVRNIF